MSELLAISLQSSNNDTNCSERLALVANHSPQIHLLNSNFTTSSRTPPKSTTWQPQNQM